MTTQTVAPAPLSRRCGLCRDANRNQSVLGELRDDHRRVVEIVVFQARSAHEACAEVDGMTPDNAYQIVRRFRQRLRAALEGDNG